MMTYKLLKQEAKTPTSKHIPGFRNGPLTEMVAVGAINSSSARLWVRAARTGAIEITCRPEGRSGPIFKSRVIIPDPNERDNTYGIQMPDASTSEGLAPLTRYFFEVTYADNGQLIGKGRFETAPESDRRTPSRFSFALMSCHQPFNKDGTLNRKSVQMLRAARHCLAQHDTKYILMVGDQLYTDFPHSLSLFNPNYFQQLAPPGKDRIQECSAAQVRRIFQERYRLFWNEPEWRAMHNEYPSYPILDDHDMIDNWGSDPAHQTPLWQAFGKGGRMAYFDYQGSRVFPADSTQPSSFHYAFTYGHTATFVMDLRSQRTAGDDGQLFSADQFHDLETFFEAHADKKVLFLVLSVPAIHLPKFVVKVAARMTQSGEDFSDRWSSGGHVRDRDRLLKMLCEHQLAHPLQKIVLLSGDIHIGCAQRIQWQADAPPLYQLISSGITHSLGRTLQLAAKLLMSMNRDLSTQDLSLKGDITFLKGTRRFRQNPYGGMNLGIIEIETTAQDSQPRLRYSLYGHHRERPVCVYRSEPF